MSAIVPTNWKFNRSVHYALGSTTISQIEQKGCVKATKALCVGLIVQHMLCSGSQKELHETLSIGMISLFLLTYTYVIETTLLDFI